jgi:hypothetical protein
MIAICGKCTLQAAVKPIAPGGYVLEPPASEKNCIYLAHRMKAAGHVVDEVVKHCPHQAHAALAVFGRWLQGR